MTSATALAEFVKNYKRNNYSGLFLIDSTVEELKEQIRAAEVAAAEAREVARTADAVVAYYKSKLFVAMRYEKEPPETPVAIHVRQV